jgi:hypothetical protein
MSAFSIRPDTKRTLRQLMSGLVVAVMFVALAPHCLFGCSTSSMMMPAAQVSSTAMDCCDGHCPMAESQCAVEEEQPGRIAALVQKDELRVSGVELSASPVETAAAASTATFASSFDPIVGTSTPARSLHLLNSQFLI